jgi:hypothetical protein
MRRVFFGVAAVLLSWAAFETQPVHACPVMDFCNNEACRAECLAQGAIDGACIGRPCTIRQCACLVP